MQAPARRRVRTNRSGYNIREVVATREIPPEEPTKGVLIDLLMAVMNSIVTWTAAAAGDHQMGLAWRDAVTTRMTARPSYTARPTSRAQVGRNTVIVVPLLSPSGS
jgi:hypothetical protein